MSDIGSSPPAVVELNPYRFGAVALRQWRWTILFPALVTLGTLIYVLVVTPRYTATALILPESRTDRNLAGGLAGVAAQIGIPLGAAAGQSPQLYADLVHSRTILDTLLQQRLPAANGHGPRLIDWLEAGGKDGPDSLYKARLLLGKRIQADLTRETGVVKLDVSLRDPVVAATVAGWVLAELDRFNSYRRQTTARARRTFLEGRIHELEGELAAAEDELRRFFEANRTYDTSPALRFRAQRLQARITFLNEVLDGIRRDFENARIDEVNDTPVLTTIDAPKVPERKSFPQRFLILVGAAFASGVLGLLAGLLANMIEELGDKDPAGRQHLASAWTDLRSKWKGPVAKTGTR